MPDKTYILQNFGLLKYLYGISYNPIETFQKISERFGDVVNLKFGDDSVLFVNHPGVIRHMLKTNAENYPRGKSVDDLAELLGNGLFNSPENIWQKQRKLLTPAFHNSQLESFYKVLKSEMEIFTNLLESYKISGESFNLEYELKKLLLNLTFKNLLSPNEIFNTDELLSALGKILKETTNKRHNFRLAKSLIKKEKVRIFDSEDLKASLKIITDTASSLFTNALNGKSTPGGMLQILISAYQAGDTTKKIAVDEIQNILFAGYDTVAEGLFWLLYFVSINGNIEKRILNEIYGKGAISNPEEFSLSSTPYLAAAIKESLRIMPPVWSFYRSSIEEEEIEGYIIPAKSFIMISPFLLHRNKKYWENPTLFDPERFIDKNENDPFHYIPFGQGKHICIGNRLATVEIHLIAAQLLEKYKFTFISPNSKLPDVLPELIISANDKVQVKISERV